MTMSLPFRRPPPRSAVALGCWDRRVLGAFMCRVSLKPLFTWLPCATGLPFFPATCAPLSPRRMVWGPVQNPTRTSGGPCEHMAGAPFGLRPMPFLASCVRHAEGRCRSRPAAERRRRPVLLCRLLCCILLPFSFLPCLPFGVSCPVALCLCCCAARCLAAAPAAVFVSLSRSVVRRRRL